MSASFSELTVAAGKWLCPSADPFSLTLIAAIQKIRENSILIKRKVKFYADSHNIQWSNTMDTTEPFILDGYAAVSNKLENIFDRMRMESMDGKKITQKERTVHLLIKSLIEKRLNELFEILQQLSKTVNAPNKFTDTRNANINEIMQEIEEIYKYIHSELNLNKHLVNDEIRFIHCVLYGHLMVHLNCPLGMVLNPSPEKKEKEYVFVDLRSLVMKYFGNLMDLFADVGQIPIISEKKPSVISISLSNLKENIKNYFNLFTKESEKEKSQSDKLKKDDGDQAKDNSFWPVLNKENVKSGVYILGMLLAFTAYSLKIMKRIKK